MKKTFLVVAVALLALSACKNSVTNGYEKTAGGLWYKILNNTNSPKAKAGDILLVNFVSKTQKDSELVNSRKSGRPFPIEVRAAEYKGDISEGLTMLGVGDSASFLLPIDSMFKKGSSAAKPAYLKSGEYLKITVAVVSVKSRDEMMKEQAAAAAQAQDQEKGNLENYLTTNKIKAEQTASGLYYVIDKKGKGPLPKAGQSVTVNYTGTLLDGTEFDSSLKPGRQPLTFVLGQGQVIKGWDEGITLLPVGSKGRLIVPSALAYGPQGNQGIPPNSPLVFSIEVLSVK